MATKTKPKKRFHVEPYGEYCYLVDEQGRLWIDGRQSAYPMWDFHHYVPDRSPLTEQEALTHLPSAEHYDILPADTPLVRVRISYRTKPTDYPPTDLILQPDAADTAQKDIDKYAPLVKLLTIYGDTVYVTVADTTAITFHPI